MSIVEQLYAKASELRVAIEEGRDRLRLLRGLSWNHAEQLAELGILKRHQDANQFDVDLAETREKAALEGALRRLRAIEHAIEELEQGAVR